MEDSLEKIIRKYLDGSATPGEVKRVEDFYNSYSREDDYTKNLGRDEKKQLENKIFLKISHRLAQEKQSIGKQRSLVFSRITKAAAVITGLLILALIYATTLSDRTTRIETAYGEVKEYILPDNSVVVLNGNSSIEYSPWNEGPRSISLSGEAYFSVTHTKNHQKFIVRIPGGLEVEVLGTEFNVTARESNTSVVLNSGVVRVNGLPADSSITLKPGERIALNPSRERVVRAVVDTERYVSWKDHKLIFDDTPLREIITTMEETYGYTVTVEDTSLLDETFTGTIPNNDIDILVIGLNKIGLDVKVNTDKISIQKR